MTLGLISLALAVTMPLMGGESATVEFFEKDVRPVLAQHCYQCHGPAQQMAGLRMDSRDSLIHGGHRGPVIVAGDADHSLLIKAIRQDGALKMPLGARLSPAEIAAIEK